MCLNVHDNEPFGKSKSWNINNQQPQQQQQQPLAKQPFSSHSLP
jgi:hypothetical protein